MIGWSVSGPADQSVVEEPGTPDSRLVGEPERGPSAMGEGPGMRDVRGTITVRGLGDEGPALEGIDRRDEGQCH